MAPVLCSNEIKVGQLDDIQELWRSQTKVIPERYIREGDERPAVSLPASVKQQIPVIDVSKLFMIDDELQAKNELAKLTHACEEWGFFQVVNHGVENDLLEGIEKVAKEFFMLPLEEKEKYPMPPGGIQGYGHAFIFSEDQKLDWCNMFALGIEPSFIRVPKLWPENPSNFNKTLVNYSASIRLLCQKLLEFIAQGLGLGPTVFNDMFGQAVQAVRMNYYPPCLRPDLVLGLSPHSDGSALTVLQQDTHSIGLQIVKDGVWLPVEPIPNALVINVGDTIEVLTNGRYKSVEHRAVTNKDKDRLSIVTFYSPSYSIELGPMPELVPEGQPLLFKRYNHGEYSRHYVTNKLQGKKTLEFAKNQTSAN